MTESNSTRATFDLLHQEVGMLSITHQFLERVYRNQRAVEHMNSIGSSAFVLIRRALIIEAIRLVCALSDPASTGGRHNASIWRVLEELEAKDTAMRTENAATDEACECAAVIEPAMAEERCAEARARAAAHAECVQCIKAAGDSFKRLRDARNSRLMHFDLDTSRGLEPLPEVPWTDIDCCVTAITTCMQRAATAFKDKPTTFSVGNAAGEFEWMLSDSVRLGKLRALASDPNISSETLRELLKQRSDRLDDKIMEMQV